MGLVPLLVALAAALPYLPGLGNDFVWDDGAHIRLNPRIASLSAALSYFTAPEGAYYRPVVFLSYALEHGLWGTDPAGYHLTNLLLHAAASTLVLLVALRSGASRRTAMFAALFFALHPVQSEAVAYVSGRTDLLVALGGLTAWWVLRSAVGGDLTRGMLAALATAVAALSKESGMAVAALVAWLAWSYRGAWRARAALSGPSIVVVLVLLALRPGRSLWSQIARAPAFEAAAETLRTYVLLVLWPADLQVDRLALLAGSTGSRIFAAGLLLVGVGAFLALLRRPAPVREWAVWVVVFYLPVSNLLPLYPAIAERAVFVPEHNLYVPLAGVAVLLGIAADGAWRRFGPQGRRVAAMASVAIAVAYGARTAVRVLDWRSEETLFRSAAASGTMSPRVWLNLGNGLASQGRLQEAVAAYRHGAGVAPRDADLWMNLGVALQLQGRREEALDAYGRAAALEPSALLWENIGTLQLARGDRDAARRAFARALEMDPGRALARRGLERLE